MNDTTVAPRTGTGEFSRGWKVLIASLLGTAFGASPLPFNTIGFFIDPLQREFGWSKAEVSFGVTIYGVLGALLAPVFGCLADRYGVRRVALGSLATFRGVERRFDVRGESRGVTFVDDYAHLPREIETVLRGARDSSDTWSRIVAVFQPNRYNRMNTMSPEYRDAFVGADVVVVTEIYPSGTAPIPGVTGKLVVDAIRAAHPNARVEWVPTRGDLVNFLAGELREGDLCISMGCGDIESLPDEVIAARARS